MTLSLGELFLRIVIAAVLGGLIGFERELSDQPAGFRTHILVALGAALFTLAGAYGLEDFVDDSEVTARIDPTRVAAQIVTGIGFLGAGAIIQRGVSVRGLTTAAALWVTAAVGMAAGFGYVAGALAVTGVSLAALYGLKYIERRAIDKLKKGRVRFVIATRPKLRIGELTGVVEGSGGRIESIKVLDEEGDRELIIVVQLTSKAEADYLADELHRLEGVAAVDFDV
jgi:putative Mg2+ transporter-C (MgtC) family protein